MTRTAVKSSNIKSVGHDGSTNTLEVEFQSGGVWQYASVPREKFDRMVAAPSAGKYFHQWVKRLHRGRQVA